jgi:alpha,alpha-trehalase
MEIKYIFSLGELFERVQTEKVFPDNKTFVDCIPKSVLASIRQRYEKEKIKPRFKLSEFVHQNFEEPKEQSKKFETVAGTPILQHLEMLWDELTRQKDTELSSLIPLPHPYIVPGGRFREIYYWDSYFTMLGLQVSNRVDMIQNMVDNFSYLVDTFGYIPNGNRRYYVGRSQPPFYACMVKLLSEDKGSKILIDYLPQMEKEYDFWMRGTNKLNAANLSENRVALMPDGNILNHYWDENDYPRPEAYGKEIKLAQSSTDKKTLYRHLRAACESGWDFSSRWFKEGNKFSSIHTADIVPIDLNCLLFNMEQTIAEAYQLKGDKTSCQKFITASDNRKEAIQKYCWNEEKGFYFDYDYVSGIQKNSETLAAAFTLFFEIASKEQAVIVKKFLEKNFMANGGVLTTTETTDQQWDSPNGWAPLQWIAIQGLAKYGHVDLAKEIAKRWMDINEKVYENTGKMMEKYNIVATDLTAGGGEYPSQDGFGWTNGVYLALDKWIKNF